MRSLLIALFSLLPLAALADPPPSLTPSCSQFGGTETGYLCAFTRRIQITPVCMYFGFGTSVCSVAYVDCEVKLTWWPGADYEEVDPSVTCSTPVHGT